MIPRRVAEHVKAHNWFAVGIDFLIVVVGVFVATQVTNWNEARLERKESALFTERLIADLREEAWGHQYLLEYYGDVLDNAQRTLAALEGRHSASDEELLISAYRATQYVQNVRRRSTYDELASTGEIGLIRDTDLRDTAMRVYTSPIFEQIAREGIVSRYREAFRMLLPAEIQDALAATCGDRFAEIGNYKAIVDSIDYECATGLPPQAIKDAADAIRKHEALIPLLRLRVADIKTTFGNLTVYNPAIKQGLQRVVGEKQ